MCYRLANRFKRDKLWCYKLNWNSLQRLNKKYIEFLHYSRCQMNFFDQPSTMISSLSTASGSDRSDKSCRPSDPVLLLHLYRVLRKCRLVGSSIFSCINRSEIYNWFIEIHYISEYNAQRILFSSRQCLVKLLTHY